MLGIGSSHSVATLINKKSYLVGFYDLRFKCVLINILLNNHIIMIKKVVYVDFISGKFNNTGYSSTNIYQYINELFLIQLKTEKLRFLQIFLFILRILKHWKKIINF